MPHRRRDGCRGGGLDGHGAGTDDDLVGILHSPSIPRPSATTLKDFDSDMIEDQNKKGGLGKSRSVSSNGVELAAR
jgi:hypothetical protein